MPMSLPADSDVPDREIRGTNQRGVRAYNERLALTLLRWQGPMSKAEIAKRTGLSPQTTSIIMRELEEAGLIVRQAPIRGRVGQPQVPFALNPEGALFFGLKVGRRSSELILIDFVGAERASRTLSYRHPTPDAVVDFARGALDEIMVALGDAAERIHGLGIATPYEMWSWPAMIGLPGAEMAAWRERDIARDIAGFRDLPVLLANDGNAACNAELIFGDAGNSPDFLYVYIGYFVGGGVVLDGSLYHGRGANAGALASMPVPAPGGGARQLIEPASIATLERQIERAGGRQVLLTDRGDWDVPAALLEAWLDEAAGALAHAAISAAALLDLRTVILDGWLPAPLRAELVARTASAIAAQTTAGIHPPTVTEGTLGSRARSLGAAALVLASRYMVDQTALYGRV
jgi:predicted NBD/HSP70 family sugar kinase